MGKVFFLERTIDIRLRDSHEQYEIRALSENMTVHYWPVCIINMNHADEHLYSLLLLEFVIYIFTMNIFFFFFYRAHGKQMLLIVITGIFRKGFRISQNGHHSKCFLYLVMEEWVHISNTNILLCISWGRLAALINALLQGQATETWNTSSCSRKAQGPLSKICALKLDILLYPPEAQTHKRTTTKSSPKKAEELMKYSFSSPAYRLILTSSSSAVARLCFVGGAVVLEMGALSVLGLVISSGATG